MHTIHMGLVENATLWKLKLKHMICITCITYACMPTIKLSLKFVGIVLCVFLEADGKSLIPVCCNEYSFTHHSLGILAEPGFTKCSRLHGSSLQQIHLPKDR